ncbi:MAG: Yip1 family protein [Spirochaetota bacterium]
MKELFERVKNILFNPLESWQKIKEEQEDIKTFLTSYVLILSAIIPLAQFFGFVIFGRIFGIRINFFKGLLDLIISYFVQITGIILASFVMSQLSVTLNYKKDFMAHFKLICYSLTPYWILGIFYLIPPIWLVSLIGALYSIYLIFLGADKIIEISREKTFIYIIILVIILFIIYFVINLSI